MPDRFSVTIDAESRFVSVTYCSTGFFDLLGVRSFRGRLFTAADAGAALSREAILSHAFWRTLGSPSDIVGRSIRIAGSSFDVIGVAEPGFFGVEVGKSSDLYLLLSSQSVIRGHDSGIAKGSAVWLHVLGRLRKGQSRDDAAEALRRWQPALRAATLVGDRPAAQHLPEPLDLVSASTGVSRLREEFGRSLSLLLGGVCLVLALACANLVALFLAVFADRQHEIATRRALGASRVQLVRELLAESITVGAAGALLGTLLAWWTAQFVGPFLSTPLDRGIAAYIPVQLDWHLVSAALALAMICSISVGIGPALYYSSPRRTVVVNSVGRQVVGQGAGGRLMAAFVAGQIGISLALVVASSLVIRSYVGLVSRDLAVNHDGVLLAAIDGPLYQPNSTATIAKVEALLSRVAALPGVEVVSASTLTPLSGMIMLTPIDVPGFVSVDRRDFNVSTNRVTPGFLQVFGTELQAGRDFNQDDGPGHPPVAIVNRAFADYYFPGQDAVGRIVRLRERDTEIVGIVPTGRYMNVAENTMHVAYVPWAQWVGTSPLPVRLGVRAQDPAAVRQPLLDVVRSFDPSLGVQFRTLEDEISTSLNRERLLALLGGVIGLLALLIASVGAYGTAGYLVRRRRSEFAVRLALGANGGTIFRLVVREAGVVLAYGTAIGLALSLAATKGMGSVLHGISATDPRVLLIGTAIVVLVVGLSVLEPALTAARTDPVAGLREDASA